MPRSLIVLALVGLLAPFARAADAAQCDDVTFPDGATLEETTLTLNGLGLRLATMFDVHVYVAGLYLPARSDDATAILGTDQAWLLDLRFVRDVDGEDIRDAWEDGFEDNYGDGAAPLQERIDALKGWMEDVAEGEALAFAYTPATGLTVSVKGQTKGVIGGADFARGLLGVFIGDEPPNDELKEGLLGGACE